MNAREWLATGVPGGIDGTDVAVLGAPISRASLSPSEAWSTPPAFREALARFPTWDAEHEVDIAVLRACDLGDVPGDRDDLDATAAHARLEDATHDNATASRALVLIGGDNSLTRPALRGLMSARADRQWGLLTLDAHHDCRPADPGSSNGTPVRELIEAGLRGDRVTQIGIHPFGNAREHAQWAYGRGVHVYGLAHVREFGVHAAVDNALAALHGSGVDAIYVDVDLDVVDRAHAPACPASLPGGLTPSQLIDAVHRIALDERVVAADITEVDANADVNGITVRLAATVFVGMCSAFARRRQWNQGA